MHMPKILSHNSNNSRHLKNRNTTFTAYQSPTTLGRFIVKANGAGFFFTRRAESVFGTENNREVAKDDVDDLDDANLVSLIKSVVVPRQLDVCLLLSIGPDQGVDLGNVDLVQLLDGRLDVVLVGLSVYQEDQSVAVLNLLHRCFSGQRILNYIESVHPANKIDFAISVCI
jgi:hypothetical protein